jgi:hypothetical protein
MTEFRKIRCPLVPPQIALISLVVVLSLRAEPLKAEDAKDAIPTGEAYVYGNRIEPPYVLAVEGNTLFLNSIPVDPRPVRPTVSPSVSHTTRSRFDLDVRVSELHRNLRAQNLSESTIIARMAARYAEDTALVDSVRIGDSNSFWVYWKGESGPEEILVREAVPQPSRAEQLVTRSEILRHALTMGSIIFIGTVGDLLIPTQESARVERVRAAVARAVEAKPSDFDDGTWRDPELPAHYARDLRSPLPLPSRR